MWANPNQKLLQQSGQELVEGRAGFLQWHNAQGVNEDDLDQLFVDMYAEYIDTEIGGANASLKLMQI